MLWLQGEKMGSRFVSGWRWSPVSQLRMLLLFFSDHFNLCQGQSNTFTGHTERVTTEVDVCRNQGDWMPRCVCFSVCISTLCVSRWSHFYFPQGGMWSESLSVTVNSDKPSSPLLRLIDEPVCVCLHKYASVIDPAIQCGRGSVCWMCWPGLSCSAVTGSGGRVIQVLECEVPIELWKWELSREMGIAPRWFVTFAVLFGAFIVHSIKMCVSHVCPRGYIMW